MFHYPAAVFEAYALRILNNINYIKKTPILPSNRNRVC